MGRLLSDGTRTTADNSWLWVVTHSLGSWRCRPLSVARYCRELRSSLHGDFRLLSALFHFSCSLFSTLRAPRQLCRNEAAPRRKTHSDLMRHATSPNPKTLRHKVLVLAGGRESLPCQHGLWLSGYAGTSLVFCRPSSGPPNLTVIASKLCILQSTARRFGRDTGNAIGGLPTPWPVHNHRMDKARANGITLLITVPSCRSQVQACRTGLAFREFALKFP